MRFGIGVVSVVTFVGCSLGSVDLSPVRQRATGEVPQGSETTASNEDMLIPDEQEDALEPSGDNDRLPTPTTPGEPSESPSIDVKWNAVPGFRYALSVKSGGEWLFPCLGADVLGTSTSVRYAGICQSIDKRPVAVSDITAYRIHYSKDDGWNDFVESPARANVVQLQLPTAAPSSVALHWNRITATAEYSLDITMSDGKFIAPCVGAIELLKSTAYTFKGKCPTANNVGAPIANIVAFRICSAEGGDWANAICTPIDYNGLRGEVAIPN